MNKFDIINLYLQLPLRSHDTITLTPLGDLARNECQLLEEQLLRYVGTFTN